MSRRNYKVYANLGFTRRSTRRYAVILDTGEGSSFTRKDVLQTQWNRIKPATSDLCIRDAGNHHVNIAGFIDISVLKVGSQIAAVKFYVVDKFGTDVIPGCAFYNKHIEAISPRRRVVERDDRTTVPIM